MESRIAALEQQNAELERKLGKTEAENTELMRKLGLAKRVLMKLQKQVENAKKEPCPVCGFKPVSQTKKKQDGKGWAVCGVQALMISNFLFHRGKSAQKSRR
jgi:DNA repair exonuclease SbcCD ATPase subunit